MCLRVLLLMFVFSQYSSVKQEDSENMSLPCSILMFEKYPSLQHYDWHILYVDSMYADEYLSVSFEAYTPKKDTICQIEVLAFFSMDTTIVTLLSYIEEYEEDDTIFHTEFDCDSILIPRFKYKYTKQNPEKLIFEFGQDNIGPKPPW